MNDTIRRSAKGRWNSHRPLAVVAAMSMGLGGFGGMSAVLPSAASAAGTPLTICVDTELTGTFAAISAPPVNGAKAEVDHLNAKGGILGHPLKLVVLNNQSQASLAAQVAEECIQKEHAWAIIGSSENTEVIPMIPIVNQAKVPAINWGAGWNYPGSGLPAKDYEGYDFPGRATSAFSDFLMLQDYVVPHHLKRVAMIEANSAGSLVAGQDVMGYVKKDHLTLTTVQQISPTATNLTPTVLALLKTKPQAIIMNSIAGATSVTFLQALRTQNANIPAGVCAGCTTSEFISSVGGPKGVHNVYSLGNPEDLLKVVPHTKENQPTFTDINNYYKWMKKAGFKSTDDLNSGNEGWNTVEMLADAAKKANSVDQTGIMHALQHEHDDTTGQLWARTPTNYDNVDQQNAIVTIRANGTTEFVKSVAST